jgi:hypothetical protein
VLFEGGRHDPNPDHDGQQKTPASVAGTQPAAAGRPGEVTGTAAVDDLPF